MSLCCTLTSQQSKCDFPYFKKNHIVTLTGYFVKYTLLLLCWTPIYLKSFLSTRSWKHSLELTQLLQICWLHIPDVNLPFCHIPKVSYCHEIRGLWRPFQYREAIVRAASLRQSELCDMTYYPTGSIHQKMGTLWS